MVKSEDLVIKSKLLIIKRKEPRSFASLISPNSVGWIMSNMQQRSLRMNTKYDEPQATRAKFRKCNYGYDKISQDTGS